MTPSERWIPCTLYYLMRLHEVALLPCMHASSLSSTSEAPETGHGMCG